MDLDTERSDPVSGMGSGVVIGDWFYDRYHATLIQCGADHTVFGCMQSMTLIHYTIVAVRCQRCCMLGSVFEEHRNLAQGFCCVDLLTRKHLQRGSTVLLSEMLCQGTRPIV